MPTSPAELHQCHATILTASYRAASTFSPYTSLAATAATPLYSLTLYSILLCYSMQIYQNHRQMAADFVKVQSDLIDLKRVKTELEDQLGSDCFAGEETEKVLRLNAEKESLVQFSKKLKTQLRLIKNALMKPNLSSQQQQHLGHQPQASAIVDGDWVVVHQEK